MPIFVNQARDYFIITSFKVTYSTLAAHDSLSEKFLTNYLDCIRFKGQQSQKQTVMLVRNPYDRIVSFFEDKFIRHPNMPASKRVKYSDRDGWQACQIVFFPYLNINSSTPPNTIATKLKNTSFSQFVSCLPRVYLQDEHLIPQINNIKFQTSINSSIDSSKYSDRLIHINLNVDKIIKIEALDREYMKQQFGLDFSIIKNRNPDQKPLASYFNSSSLLETINSLYEKDFNYFNYPQYSQALRSR